MVVEHSTQNSKSTDTRPIDHRNVATVTGRDKPNKYTPDGVARVVSWIERVNIRHSRLGNPAVYSTDDFPWIKEFETAAPIIREELLGVMRDRERLPNFHDIVKEVKPITSDDNWKTFILAGMGVRFAENAKRCPRSARLVESIPGMKTAFFSILSPRKQIPPHKGVYNGVLRYHLGLMVPQNKEDCTISIAGQTFNWEEGRSLVFDDTFEHSVSNNTDDYRVILFVDFLRPVKFPFSLLNRTLLGVSPLMMPNLRDAKHKHDAWIKDFYNQGNKKED